MKKPVFKLSCLLSPLFLLGGCVTPDLEADVPALVVLEDAASRAELRQIFSNLFGGQEILLADDAFTRSSELTLEAGDSSISGRSLDEPLRFQLVFNKGNCALIDRRDNSRHPLTVNRCVPE